LGGKLINKNILRKDVIAKIKEIKKADIMVGIPSFNNAKTIEYVVKMAAEGIAKYFPQLEPVIFNSDGGSTDGTASVVLNTKVPEGVEVITTQYRGIPGKGSSFRTIFEMANALEVKACVVVDSDLRSITPEWIMLLAKPIIDEGYNYVTPYYIRHKYDATITNSIAYPLTRALYGMRIRQPIGGDFGISNELSKSCLIKDVWDTDVAKYGIDIFMTTTAINEGHRICQAQLGAKIHDVKDPALTLGPMFIQVVGTLFRLIGTYHNNWKDIRGSKSVMKYGESKEDKVEPINVSIKSMIDKFKVGIREFGFILNRILHSENYSAIEHISELSYYNFSFPSDLWVKSVYDFAVAYNKRIEGLNPDEIVQIMTPLYYGRTASFVIESQDMTTEEAENLIENLSITFEKLKPYLIQRW
jgi:glycosyltransferase involved in cell wall biosynthesis